MRSVLEQLPVDPRPEGFFDELWQEVYAREHSALRIWRRRAVVLGAVTLGSVALAASVVAARSSNVFDETLRCAVQQRAGLPVFTISANPQIPGTPDPSKPFPATLIVTTGLDTHVLAFDTAHSGYQLNTLLCRRAHPALALKASGLPSSGTFTDQGYEGFALDCKLPGPLVFRIRLTHDSDNNPTAAQLMVRAGKKQAPIAYLAWTSKRVVSHATPRCDQH